MFAKEIILKKQLAAPCLFQCSVDRKLAANVGTLDYLNFEPADAVGGIVSGANGF
jgi:hypothetical protein